VADRVLASELEPHLVGDRLCCPSVQRVRVQDDKRCEVGTWYLLFLTYYADQPKHIGAKFSFLC
jgi:hypothetical protein